MGRSNQVDAFNTTIVIVHYLGQGLILFFIVSTFAKHDHQRDSIVRATGPGKGNGGAQGREGINRTKDAFPVKLSAYYSTRNNGSLDPLGNNGDLIMNVVNNW